MGTLRIGAGHVYRFDDRALQLLRTVLTKRLGAGRSFDLFVHPPHGEWAAERVLVTPQTSAMFLFHSSTVNTVDDIAIEGLMTEMELTGALQCASSS